jgi:hypothetical protein
MLMHKNVVRNVNQKNINIITKKNQRMKKISLLIVLITLVLSGFSQSYKTTEEDYTLDSIITKWTLDFMFDTVTIYKETFSYNDNYNLTSDIFFINIDYPIYEINWLNFEETLYTYSDSYNLTSRLYREREHEDADIQNVNLWTYQFVEDDYQSILAYWQNEEWEPTLRITQNYDTLNFYKKYIKEYANEITSEWELFSRTDTVLRPDLTLDTIKMFRWDDPQIMDTLRITKYFYGYFPDTIINYTDSLNGLLEKEYYDNECDCYVFLRASIDSGIVKPYYKTHEMYDVNNNLIWYQRFESFGSTLQWDSAGHTQYIYNDSSQLIEKRRLGIGGCEKNLYEYNSYGLLSKEKYIQNMAEPDIYYEYYYYYTYKYVDIKEECNKVKIVAYPNPSSTQIKINNLGRNYDHFTLTSLNGKIIKSGNIHSDSEILDVTDINKGIYILSLKSKSTSLNQKIIVN